MLQTELAVCTWAQGMFSVAHQKPKVLVLNRDTMKKDEEKGQDLC